MKRRLLVALAVFFFLFSALVYAGDQNKEKDKKKTNPPPKQTAVVHPKPKTQTQHNPASHPQQKTTPQPQHKPAPAPKPKAAVHPTGPNTATPGHGQLNRNGQGVQRGQQGKFAVRHVTVRELHQRMNAPVSRDVLIRERARYHQVELGRFRIRGGPVVIQPRYRPVLMNLRIVPGTYYHRRAVFYETYGWTPPVYIYSLRPSYGLWCATFLAFMLDRIAIDQQYEYSLMYYDHMNEPDFIQWRQEMNGLAAENGELREKLAALDQRVSQLEGTPRNPAYVPDDAGDVAVSPQVIDKLTSGPEK
jgi:hypothetical protein